MTTFNPKWARADWRFVVLWALFVPWAQSLSAKAVNAFVGETVDEFSYYPILFIANALMGAGIGLAQWIVLRAWAYKNLWWILATSLGWALGAIVDVATMPLFARSAPLFIVLSRVMLVSLPGIVASIPQWLVLRQVISRSALWILINAVTWIGISLVMVYNFEMTTIMLLPTVAWTIIGIGLLWLMRHPKS